jgi:hypothetical protein
MRGGLASARMHCGLACAGHEARVRRAGGKARVRRAREARVRGNEAGQAAVELVGGLPALLLVAVVVMQLLAVGYTAVLAGDAAEAGALAMARGAGPAMAARSAIPGWAREGMQVRRAAGAVHVQMQPPHLVPWVGSLLRIRASAAVAAPGRTGLL